MDYFSNFGAPLHEGFVSDDKWQCKDTNNTYEGIKFKLKKMNTDYSIVVEVVEEGSDGDVIERTLRIIGKNFDFKKHADNTIINSNSEVDLDKLLCIDYSSLDFDGEPITVEFEWGKDKKVKYELMDEGDGDDVEPFYNYEGHPGTEPVEPDVVEGDEDDEPEVVEPEVVEGDEPEVDEPEVDEPEVDEPEVDEPEDNDDGEEFNKLCDDIDNNKKLDKKQKEMAKLALDCPEPFVGSVEGFVGNNGNNIGQNVNVRLLLKSLLFACLFYLLAHNDTKKVLLNVVKLGKDNYLYLATVLFFVAYLILNILV